MNQVGNLKIKNQTPYHKKTYRFSGPRRMRHASPLKINVLRFLVLNIYWTSLKSIEIYRDVLTLLEIPRNDGGPPQRTRVSRVPCQRLRCAGAPCTVGFHNFDLRIFNLRVSSPNNLIGDAFLTRCRISMCQGLGPDKHDEISEIDRMFGSLSQALTTGVGRVLRGLRHIAIIT